MRAMQSSSGIAAMVVQLVLLNLLVVSAAFALFACGMFLLRRSRVPPAPPAAPSTAASP